MIMTTHWCQMTTVLHTVCFCIHVYPFLEIVPDFNMCCQIQHTYIEQAATYSKENNLCIIKYFMDKVNDMY